MAFPLNCILSAVLVVGVHSVLTTKGVLVFGECALMHRVVVGSTNSAMLLERADTVLKVTGLMCLSEPGSFVAEADARVINLVSCTVVPGEDSLGRVSLTVEDSFS